MVVFHRLLLTFTRGSTVPLEPTIPPRIWPRKKRKGRKRRGHNPPARYGLLRISAAMGGVEAHGFAGNHWVCIGKWLMFIINGCYHLVAHLPHVLCQINRGYVWKWWLTWWFRSSKFWKKHLHMLGRQPDLHLMLKSMWCQQELTMTYVYP